MEMAQTGSQSEAGMRVSRKLFLSFLLGLLGLASSTGELARAVINANGVAAFSEKQVVAATLVASGLFLIHLIGTLRSILLASRMGKA